MMSHIHLDHIIGLPFFKPMFRRSSEIKIYGPCFNGTDFRRALGAAIAPPYFPIAIPNMGANIELIGISGDKLRIGEVSVTPKRLNHPQGTYGWRFDLANGMSVVHVSDSEPCDESCIDETAEWMFGADMLIHDAQFTPKEYKSRRGWGHSPYTYPIELASRSGIGKLFLFHFDMDASDDDLRAMHRHAQSMIKKKKLRLECELAREGLSIDV
jgi:ribonuclease BN (tRNA processing enzyme)